MMRTSSSRRLESGESVFVDELCLRRSRPDWPFALEHRSRISAHWADAVKSNPHIFNGTIFPLLDHAVVGRQFCGEYAESDFASYLYWRGTGFADAPTCDGFASVMLQSSRERFLFAKAARYTLNSGLWVPPGGMLDERDVDDAGKIDVWRYGLRELTEETSLTIQDVSVLPGHQVACDGALIAYGLFCRSKLSEEEVLSRFQCHNRQLQETPELDELCWFSIDEALVDPKVPKFVKLMLRGWSKRHDR